MKPGRAFVRNGLKPIADRLLPMVKHTVERVLTGVEYVPHGWYALPGWNDPSVVEAQEKHWPVIVRNLEGTGPLGVSHLPWHSSRELRPAHNVMMSYGYVLARAAHHKDRIAILDWGGGLGHYHLYTQALLPEIAVDYHCYELPAFCQAGRKLQPQIRFYEDESELTGNQYDLVLSSSSLHYCEDWRAGLAKLAALTREFLYIARLLCVREAPTYVALDRAYRDGYREFLSWCINRTELITCAEASDLQLVREFVFDEPITVRGAPEHPETRGFLFRRVAADKS
jgi:putative methyltransferase (TIGR04325 family)